MQRGNLHLKGIAATTQADPFRISPAQSAHFPSDQQDRRGQNQEGAGGPIHKREPFPRDAIFACNTSGSTGQIK